ncbi:trypsin-like peptidase domain-containing protein [Alicyclobacillus sp.]|uniref:S1C family serine protease n=1 Tax=Alicyclobacillus sp. TaxID=61169 RepID=UPI0025B8B14E|nr:trypsin-like peptidase domain-containing protein [Alicyclobacillus sp.]
MRWLATVVLSAAVGAGVTLYAESAFGRNGVTEAAVPAAAPESSGGGQTVTSVSVSVSDGITQAVKRVQPAVVGVVNYARVSDFFTQTSKLEATGVGTGVLIRKDAQYGYIVTNNHVVEGAAKVEAVLEQGKHVQASVVGTDPYTDLAVLRVPVAPFQSVQPAQFANSDDIQVGEPAIAIGTPMGLDFADTVTAGIVSAKQRIMPVEEPQTHQTLDYQAVIQTDAAINPGNSGGPLLNIHGEVIGINSSKIVAPNFEGMGFAIPSNAVRSIAQEIMQTGHASHPALGISGYSLSSLPQQWWPDVPVDYGVFVRSVSSDSAKQAGLQPQDVIVAIDGRTVKNMADLRTYLFQKKPGDKVTLRVYRGTHRMDMTVQLGSMPTQNTASAAADGRGAEEAPFGIPNPFGD